MEKDYGKKRIVKKYYMKILTKKITNGQSHKKCGGYEDDNDLFTIKNSYEIADNYKMRNAQARPHQKKKKEFS